MKYLNLICFIILQLLQLSVLFGIWYVGYWWFIILRDTNVTQELDYVILLIYSSPLIVGFYWTPRILYFLIERLFTKSFRDGIINGDIHWSSLDSYGYEEWND